MKMTKFSVGQVLSVVLAGLLFITSFAFGPEAKAFAFDDALTQAGKSFLSSVVSDYTKDTQTAFDKQLNLAKQDVKELSAQLERASNPNIKPSERNQILSKIAASQKNLQKVAASFDGLAQQTENFDNQLEGSVQDLLNAVQGQVRDKLTGNRNSFQEISKAISAIADDTKDVNANDLASFLSQVGGHIKTLNQTFNVANKAIQSFAG